MSALCCPMDDRVQSRLFCRAQPMQINQRKRDGCISGWFYLSMIILIAICSIMSSVVIMVQKLGRHNDLLSPRVVRLVLRLSRLLFIPIPVHLTGDQRIVCNVSLILQYVRPITNISWPFFCTISFIVKDLPWWEILYNKRQMQSYCRPHRSGRVINWRLPT